MVGYHALYDLVDIFGLMSLCFAGGDQLCPHLVASYLYVHRQDHLPVFPQQLEAGRIDPVGRFGR